MTPDQIEQLARKAGGRPFADEGNPGKPLFKFRQKQLAKFVRLVLEDRRPKDDPLRITRTVRPFGAYEGSLEEAK